jgi:hypothetical protein
MHRFPPSRNSCPTLRIAAFVLNLKAVVLIAEVMRRETHHDLLLHNAAARGFFREYSAPCK